MRKILLIPLFSLLFAACSPRPLNSSQANTTIDQPEPAKMIPSLTADAVQPTIAPVKSNLPDLGAAPELKNDVWINADSPLRMADLKGKVVLMDMWTFGCINCRNVIPSLKEWHDKYHQDGLVIIGNHYPEFTYESDLDNLRQAVKDFDIQYAVAQDNDGTTWRAYKNRYWPTIYLIDKNGHIRYSHIGEGAYSETEKAIKDLLAE